jgi:hypothetical protein
MAMVTTIRVNPTSHSGRLNDKHRYTGSTMLLPIVCSVAAVSLSVLFLGRREGLGTRGHWFVAVDGSSARLSREPYV